MPSCSTGTLSLLVLSHRGYISYYYVIVVRNFFSTWRFFSEHFTTARHAPSGNASTHPPSALLKLCIYLVTHQRRNLLVYNISNNIFQNIAPLGTFGKKNSSPKTPLLENITPKNRLHSHFNKNPTCKISLMRSIFGLFPMEKNSFLTDKFSNGTKSHLQLCFYFEHKFPKYFLGTYFREIYT